METNLITQSKNPRRVLLVEDDLYWQFMISESLRHHEQDIDLYCVRSLEHAEQALTAERGRFDLIIADHHLKGTGTGVDLWKLYHAKLSRTAFVLVSGSKKKIFHKLFENEVLRPMVLEKPLDARKIQIMLRAKADSRASIKASGFHLKVRTLIFMAMALTVVLS